MAESSAPSHHDEDDNGVLDEPVADTSGIFLGGSTAQVTVSFGAGADEDDSVVDDEAPADAVAEALASSERREPLDTAEAEIIEDETEIDDAADARVEVPVAEPVRAVENPPASYELTLASKRLGELEASREGADVLTAERLLDPHHVTKVEPEGFWQATLYRLSGTLINVGDSKRARARKELDARIAAGLPGGSRFVPILSRKGGVGKTTVTTLLGMALADARDDRVIAVDANPDRGTLADRISRTSGKTIRDLVRIQGEVGGYNDLSTIVARDETRLDILASDADPRVSEAFGDEDYRAAASVAAHYYSVVLTDTGTGIVHSVMGATLERADTLVIVAGLSIDEARLASETLTWLETNGHADKVRNAVVVLNTTRPGSPLVRANEVAAHFRTRVRSVVAIPYDSHIAAGTAISFRDITPATREAARQLAAAVVEALRAASAGTAR
ncbi:MinD/ParA family protein [Microbacterium sediminicola]|uniref:MinD/ParA family ATP-binding protein n=1 Tax=Microbacterium sediminicola TaxID=415210 RepID=UPI0031DA6B1A